MLQDSFYEFSYLDLLLSSDMLYTPEVSAPERLMEAHVVERKAQLKSTKASAEWSSPKPTAKPPGLLEPAILINGRVLQHYRSLLTDIWPSILGPPLVPLRIYHQPQ
jgi:hypothetical protein